MNQNAKRDAARRELRRLLKGLEFYRAWRISGIWMVNGEVRQDDLDEIVEPGANFLAYFDNAGSQYGQILTDVKDWYSHTYSDLCQMMNVGSEAVSSEIRQFLRDFRNETGLDFQSEAGLVAKTIRRVLKRGKIANENEYFLLAELEKDGDHNFLKGGEFDRVAIMLRQFENR